MASNNPNDQHDWPNQVFGNRVTLRTIMRHLDGRGLAALLAASRDVLMEVTGSANLRTLELNRAALGFLDDGVFNVRKIGDFRATLVDPESGEGNSAERQNLEALAAGSSDAEARNLLNHVRRVNALPREDVNRETWLRQRDIKMEDLGVEGFKVILSPDLVLVKAIYDPVMQVVTPDRYGYHRPLVTISFEDCIMASIADREEARDAAKGNFLFQHSYRDGRLFVVAMVFGVFTNPEGHRSPAIHYIGAMVKVDRRQGEVLWIKHLSKLNSKHWHYYLSVFQTESACGFATFKHSRDQFEQVAGNGHLHYPLLLKCFDLLTGHEIVKDEDTSPSLLVNKNFKVVSGRKNIAILTKLSVPGATEGSSRLGCFIVDASDKNITRSVHLPIWPLDETTMPHLDGLNPEFNQAVLQYEDRVLVTCFRVISVEGSVRRNSCVMMGWDLESEGPVCKVSIPKARLEWGGENVEVEAQELSCDLRTLIQGGESLGPNMSGHTWLFVNSNHRDDIADGGRRRHSLFEFQVNRSMFRHGVDWIDGGYEDHEPMVQEDDQDVWPVIPVMTME